MIKPGDVISYLEMCHEEGVNLQRGINFKLGGTYSVILMSLRSGAPYADRIEDNGRILIYEGHDIPKRQNDINPKKIDHGRLIPAQVKLEVWKRDRGKCILCGSTDNLHFDHIIPYSKGGSSLVAENIQLLCARHNIAKRDKIDG